MPAIIRLMIQSSAQSEFVPFGPPHIMVMLVLVLVSAILSLTVRYTRSKTIEWAVRWGLVVVLLGSEWFNYVYTLTHEGFDYFLQNSLPLHACGVAIYLSAYMLITKNQRVFEVVYFWGLAGTTQGILTPVVEQGFPSYRFFHFFIAHAAIVVTVFVATVGMKMRPCLKGMWFTYMISWILAGTVGGLNLLLGTNYMYLCQRPPCTSPFYFLSWPWYIPFLGVLALILFILLYLPFAFSKNTSYEDSRELVFIRG